MKREQRAAVERGVSKESLRAAVVGMNAAARDYDEAAKRARPRHLQERNRKAAEQLRAHAVHLQDLIEWSEEGVISPLVLRRTCAPDGTVPREDAVVELPSSLEGVEAFDLLPDLARFLGKRVVVSVQEAA